MKMSELTVMYISYKLSLGEKARTIRFILKNFCSQIGPGRDLTTISEKDCLCYLNMHGIRNGEVTAYWFSIYAVLNGFFMWAVARKHMEANPLPKYKPQKPEAFVPYVFSNEELKRIFETALNYRRRYNIEYPEVIQAMLKLTYCLGLRPSETTRLVVDDINLQDGVALIRETKFYKSRMVPFGEEVSRMLENYLSWRAEAVMSRGITENHLFIDKGATWYICQRSNRLSASSGRRRASIVRLLPIPMSVFKTFAIHLRQTVSPNGIEKERTFRPFCRYCPPTWGTVILTAPQCISLSRTNFWMMLANAFNHS